MPRTAATTLIEVMHDLGYRSDRIMELCSNLHFIEFLDAFYARAFKDGFERGAYEEMTQEDAEPQKKEQ